MRAAAAFDGPIVEVHISNIHARDELHRHSIISRVARCVICGAGPYGYILAMQAAKSTNPEAVRDALAKAD